MKQISFIVLTALFLFTLYILAFQANWLELIIFEQPVFPLGTVISWLMLLLFSTLLNLIIHINRFTRIEKLLKLLLKFNIILAICWGFVSYFLAGNWFYSFGNSVYFKIWIFYSAVILLLPLIVFVVSIMQRIWFRVKN